MHERNQCLTPLNGPPAQIWRIRAGCGAYPLPAGGGELPGWHMDTGGEAMDAAGVELGASPVDRLCGERGNRPVLPSPRAASTPEGQARRLLMAPGGAEAP